MENLLPRLKCVDLDGPPPDLSHLHWKLNVAQHASDSALESLVPAAPPVAAAVHDSHGQHPLPRTTTPQPPRVLYLPAKGAPYSHAGKAGGPNVLSSTSPLSSANRGMVPALVRHLHIPQTVKVPRFHPVYMSLFNGVEAATIDVYYSVGREVQQLSLPSFETSMHLICGKRPVDPTEEDDQETKISKGFSVTAVAESTLEFEQSREDGRLYQVDFGPDLLGMDLAMDREKGYVVVKDIKPGGQADRQGTVRVGDRVLSINGIKIKGIADVQCIAATRDVGLPMSMELIKPRIPSTMAHEQKAASKFQVLQLWTPDRPVDDETKRLELDENDCALAPRTILSYKQEQEMRPLAGNLAHLVSSSVDDRLPVTFQFSNRTSRYIVVVYWIDYDGVRRYRNTLKPGEAYMEKSFVSHPWLVRCTERVKNGKVPPRPPNAHAMIFRLGPEAARSGYTMTALWEPNRSSLSVMPISRADVGRWHPKDDPSLRPEEKPLEAKVRRWRAEMLQDLRDLRSVSLPSESTSPSPGTSGLPHASIAVLDHDPRVGEALQQRLGAKFRGSAVHPPVPPGATK